MRDLREHLIDCHILGIENLNLRRVDLSHEIAQIAECIQWDDIDKLEISLVQLRSRADELQGLIADLEATAGVLKHLC